MQTIRLLGTFILFFSFSSFLGAQERQSSWEQAQRGYIFPEWFSEARFGIWVHWGAQSQPAKGGGWYARHMYMQNVGAETWGANAYPYHQKTYGHQSEAGFKEVIHAWKADKLNTDELLRYFKSLGARYFMAMANHHDHFDNFASTYHPWNSVKVGPHKDIIGLFSKSAVKYGLPFAVSWHDDRFLDWWRPAFGADTSGAKAGMKYDAYLTKADGKGKWWEGLDPADLYGLPPEKRTEAYVRDVKENFVKRAEELVSKYPVDMLWFDGMGFPYGDYGKEVCAFYFKHSRQQSGKVQAVIAGKFRGEPATVRDIERGGASRILNYPWQGTLTFDSWFYKTDRPIRHSARTVIETLSDMISKNGNLMLNVELLPDGRIPPAHKRILDTIGRFVTQNEAAIYKSKPWKIYGDNFKGLVQRRDLSETNLQEAAQSEEGFNERTIASPPYAHNEVRFTTRSGILYIFVLNPVQGEVLIPALGMESGLNVKKITRIWRLADKRPVSYKQNASGLSLSVPAAAGKRYTEVYAVAGAL